MSYLHLIFSSFLIFSFQCSQPMSFFPSFLLKTSEAEKKLYELCKIPIYGNIDIEEHLKEIEKILKQKVAVNIMHGAIQETPLMAACIRNKTKVCELLLRYRANPNAQGINGMTPLMLAIRFAKLPTIKLMIEHSNVAVVNNDGENALAIALTHNQNPEILQLLLAKDTISNGHLIKCLKIARNLNLRDFARELIDKILEKKSNINYNEVFMAACRFHFIDIIEIFMSKKLCSPSYKDAEKRTPLIMAIQASNYEIIKKLLNNGFSVEGEDNSNKTIIMYAFESENHKIWKKILKTVFSHNYTIRFNEWATIFHAIEKAIANEDFRFLQTLLSSNEFLQFLTQYTNITDEQLNLFIAATMIMGKMQLLDAFEQIDFNDDLVFPNSMIYRPVTQAVHYGQIKVIDYLIKKNVSFNYGPPLKKACEIGNIALVKLLIENGEDPNKENHFINELLNSYKALPLLIAEKNNRKEVVDIARMQEYIVKYSIDGIGLNILTKKFKDKPHILKMLLAANEGLDEYLKDPLTFVQHCEIPQPHQIEPSLMPISLLSIACAYGHTGVIKFLLNKKEMYQNYIDFRDEYGFTALDYAFEFEQFEALETLTTCIVKRGFKLNFNRVKPQEMMKYAISHNNIYLINRLLNGLLGRHFRPALMLDKPFMSALEYSIFNNRDEITTLFITYLEKNRLSFNAPNYVLKYLIEQGNLKVLNQLFSVGTKPTFKLAQYASNYNHIIMARILSLSLHNAIDWSTTVQNKKIIEHMKNISTLRSCFQT